MQNCSTIVLSVFRKVITVWKCTSMWHSFQYCDSHANNTALVVVASVLDLGNTPVLCYESGYIDICFRTQKFSSLMVFACLV